MTLVFINTLGCIVDNVELLCSITILLVVLLTWVVLHTPIIRWRCLVKTHKYDNYIASTMTQPGI